MSRTSLRLIACRTCGGKVLAGVYDDMGREVEVRLDLTPLSWAGEMHVADVLGIATWSMRHGQLSPRPRFTRSHPPLLSSLHMAHACLLDIDPRWLAAPRPPPPPMDVPMF